MEIDRTLERPYQRKQIADGLSISKTVTSIAPVACVSRTQVCPRRRAKGAKDLSAGWTSAGGDGRRIRADQRQVEALEGGLPVGKPRRALTAPPRAERLDALALQIAFLSSETNIRNGLN